MLRNLHVENFALIDSLNLSFESGFTVLTGETGSGKSILLGALNLILGERADFGVIRDTSKKTSVEATFNLSGFQLESLFEQEDLDYFEETVVRREINAQGKSRAFVNDTPVQLSVLKLIAEKLIHIHSQHHTLELKNKRFHLELLDKLAETDVQLESYKHIYTTWKAKSKDLQKKREELSTRMKDADYNRFQREELEGLHLEHTDFEQLENEFKKLENLELISQSVQTFMHDTTGENGALYSLQNALHALDKIKAFDPKVNEFYERVASVRIELKDVADELEATFSELEVSPNRKYELEEQLNAFYKVAKKHGVSSQDELRSIYDGFVNDDDSFSQLEEEIERLEKQAVQLQKDLEKSGNELTSLRKSGALSVGKVLVERLKELKLEQTTLYFEVTPLERFDDTGFDQVVLYFSPNPGMSPKSVDKAASGGELSRLMLAIQLLLSAKKQLPSILFDEIDTGVSGEVAEKIGTVLRNMSANMQVFAVTHLPQVAAKGSHHWRVEKSAENGTTQTHVIPLSNQERIHEIARLMSGSNINEAALHHAKELMG
jgi:DNA repair protein RecN (Recombination protein N)